MTQATSTDDQARIHRARSNDGTEIAARVRGERVYWLDEQLPDSRVLELPGLGHMAPELGSEAVAEALVAFFAKELEPA